ncbi:hypothetical protein [Alkalihalobacillus trypoxylicola]|uniref:Glycosyl-4,4'-diaponeurosporenoate acyltransferase n=1 Tax=Alkalihalobacillus trypoxylicola TaxID=519424 RepID=A0A162CWZ2_9BACI|nr:hypothetical protein [Alkalihalobacillus trypoxylicola]KYG26979.1 glycosyl-4,4'-diaponeurosporenoate acyltransferase [Alkalihalobacillus trypoxylicola]
MPIIELSLGWLLIVNIAAWMFFHLFISYVTVNLPVSLFKKDRWLYHIKKWEKNGLFWEKLFAMKRWKEKIPDGTKLLGMGFNKSFSFTKEDDYFERYIQESRRAEFTHWLSILPAFLFFLWNPLWAGWIMILYALIINIPIIIVQRYNRPRFQRILNRKAQKTIMSKKS